ncbi:MAG: hypothetical protein LUC33_00610 [Prevotellaceae bacterium]|nr:hypothetical protein [Prevotellaceae bacterium]
MDCTTSTGTSSSENVEVRLVFLQRELLYDIRQWAFIEGDLMDDNGEATHLHQKHETQDVGEDGNVELVARSLIRSFAECLNMLFPMAREAVEDDDERDNRLRQREQYVMRLSVPACYSRSQTELLERLIHDYMVFKALWQLTSLTDPQNAAQWMAKWEDAEDRIKDAKDANYSALKRPFYPQW